MGAELRCHRWLLVAATCALVCTAARGVRAESAVLLPVRGDDALAAEKEAAHAELDKALLGQGVRVIAHADAIAAATAAGSSTQCNAVDCALELLGAVGAEIAAGIAVWRGASGAGAASVFVTLVDRSGARFPGKADVVEDDVKTAAHDALLDARSLQLLGPGPWLRVTATVDAAEVVIDGELVGTVPYRAPMTSGRHTLEVRADGYRPHVQTVDIPPTVTRQVDVSADLGVRGSLLAGAPEDDAVYADGFERGGPSLVGPLLLGVVGVGVLAADVTFVLSTGCDEADSRGTCLERGEANNGMAVLWGGVGVAAIAGAILWYALDDGPGSAPDELAVGVGPGGLSITGSF